MKGTSNGHLNSATLEMGDDEGGGNLVLISRELSSEMSESTVQFGSGSKEILDTGDFNSIKTLGDNKDNKSPENLKEN